VRDSEVMSTSHVTGVWFLTYEFVVFRVTLFMYCQRLLLLCITKIGDRMCVASDVIRFRVHAQSGQVCGKLCTMEQNISGVLHYILNKTRMWNSS
jgi:hypothetical protein